MEKEFLNGNIEYARSLSWEPSDGSAIDDHEHCIICWKSLKKDDGIIKYENKEYFEFIDEYCYKRYIKE
jgi:hypothetical protein